MGHEAGTNTRLGSLLVESGAVTTEEIRQALVAQGESGKALGELLVDRRAASRPTIQRALAEQQGVLLEEEHGFGSGLRSAIERSHERQRKERSALLAVLSRSEEVAGGAATTDRRKLIGALEGEEGATMAEYVVLLGVISAGVVSVFAALAGGIVPAIDRAISALPG